MHVIWQQKDKMQQVKQFDLDKRLYKIEAVSGMRRPKGNLSQSTNQMCGTRSWAFTSAALTGCARS
jgi:hypothetical protein